jgi:hypothetical protein
MEDAYGCYDITWLVFENLQLKHIIFLKKTISSVQLSLLNSHNVVFYSRRRQFENQDTVESAQISLIHPHSSSYPGNTSPCGFLAENETWPFGVSIKHSKVGSPVSMSIPPTPAISLWTSWFSGATTRQASSVACDVILAVGWCAESCHLT